MADEAGWSESASSSGISLPPSQWPELSFRAQARVQAATAPEVDFVLSAIVGVAGWRPRMRQSG